MTARPDDPMEKLIGDALKSAGIEYVDEDHPLNGLCLDFYLPRQHVYIECKRMASDRTTNQLRRADDVIVVQGMEAAKWFASLLSELSPPEGL